MKINKFHIFTIFLILLFLIPACSKNNDQKPEDVVKTYFNSWNNKDYAKMYSAISDGFKKIEPTAKDLDAFKKYVNSQGIIGINIADIKESLNDGSAAKVDYSILITLADGTSKDYKSSFTLKYRQKDIMPGWKLIHPYGNLIDSS